MAKASYQNKKGKKVVISITNHAKERFTERWALSAPYSPPPRDVEDTIINLFNNASRDMRLNSYQKKRNKRHGGGSLYFRASGFTFVVCNSLIITIEINSSGQKSLNRSWHFKRHYTELSDGGGDCMIV